MKLREYLPELPSYVEQGQRLGEITSFLQLNKEEGFEKYRPATFGIDQLVSQWLRQQMAYRYQMVTDLFTIAMTVEEVRSPINLIVGEVFRKGINWKPKFAVKCTRCNTEYVDSVKKCKKCGETGELREPDEEQKERLIEFMDDSNVFDQSLKEILKQVHFDVNATDDGFLYLEKEYYGEKDSEVVRSKVTGIRRIHPALMEFDLDIQGLPKNSHFVCYIDRDLEPQSQAGNCGECGRHLVPTMYTYWHRGTKKYMLDSEIIHVSKFSPSETYGWSPLMTIFEKALTLIGMDRNIYRYFFERKMPASMMVVFTDDPESLRRERANLVTQMRLDPNYIPLVAVSAKQQRGRVDMVRLFHTLQEMEYLPVRQEIRERIGAMWGVTPAWQGAPEAFGGLSTQTNQLTVMSRVVESDQTLYKDKVFPQLLDAFGVTDWLLELLQPEEKAEATLMAFAQQRVGIANTLFQMGFDVTLSSAETGIADVDFKISGEAKKPDMGGGMFGPGAPSALGVEPETGEAPEPEQAIQSMQKSSTWISELAKAGHTSPVVRDITGDGLRMWFKSNGTDWIANFGVGGKLLQVDKATFSTPGKGKKQVAKPQPQEDVKPLYRFEGLDESDDTFSS